MQDQRRSWKILLEAALLLLFILALGACSVRRPAASNTAPATVRLGYLPIYVDLPLFVALEEQQFQKEGLTPQSTRFESSPAMGTALVNDQIDLVASIAYSVALSIESRDPGKFKIFLVDAENPHDYLSALVTMPGSGVTRVEDLRGKKLGIFPGPSALTFFGLVLKKHGLDPKKDVYLSELAPGLQLQALTGGQVDALATYEPIAMQAVMKHRAVNFLPGAIESEIINPWQAGVWLISTRLLKEHPALAQKTVRACYRALDSLRANPAAAKVALGKYTGIDPDVAAKTPNIPFTKIDEVNRQKLQEHADILLREGVISRKIESAELLLKRELIESSNH